MSDGHVRPGRLVRLEWHLLAAARTPWLAASLFLLASGAALVNGSSVVQRHERAAADAVDRQAEQHAALRRDLARAEERRASAGIPQTRLLPGLPSAASVEGRVNTFRAALPPLPTAIVSAGRTRTFPQRYEFRGGSGARFWPFGKTTGTKILSGLFPEEPMDNPASVVLGTFDWAFVAVYLYPLLVVALMHDVVSGDRESGTLALLSAQPIVFRRWLGTRVAVRGAPIVAGGLLVPLVGTALVTADLSGGTVVRLGLWGVSVLAYGAAWAAFAVGVSVRARTSALSAIVTVSGWLIVVVVIPAAVVLVMPHLVPAPARLSYATAERAANLDVNARIDAAFAALNQLTRTRAPGSIAVAGDHTSFTEPIHLAAATDLWAVLPNPPWSLPMSAVEMSRGLAEARRTLVEQRLAPVLGELQASEQLGDMVFRAARFVSPALLLQAIGDDVAGTSQARHARFIAQLDVYVREREAFFTGKILERANVTVEEVATHLVPFRYRDESIAAVVRRALPPVAALIAAAGVLVLLCVRALARWPV